MIVMGLDIGLANCGWCVVDFADVEPVFVAGGVISTVKSTRKVTASSDNRARVQALVTALHAAITEHRPILLVTEAQSWPRNSAAVAKLAQAWGAALALAHLERLLVEDVTPKDLKQRMTGDGSASKEAVQAAAEAKLGTAFAQAIARLPKGKREHLGDAAGAALCAPTVNNFGLLKSLSERGTR